MSGKRSGLRRFFVVVGVLTLVVPLLLAWAAPVSAATRCVKVGGGGGCFASIQAAVNAANGGDVIHVYPGTYDESVNLSAMNPDGDLTLATVNNAGVPTPGTVTVHYSGQEAELFTTPPLNGDLTIDGFIVHSEYPGIEVAVDGGVGANRNLVIRNVTATETGDDGIRVSADGNVTISNCVASNNDNSGIHVKGAGGDVAISDSTANGNGDHGILVDVIGGVGAEAGLAAGAGGDRVTISNCTANDNDKNGFRVVWPATDSVLATNGGGNVTITNCTAKGNVEFGFDLVDVPGQLTIQNCIARDNGDGMDLGETSMAGGVLVNGNIICGNECGVVIVEDGGIPNLMGNWWGCAEGPDDPGCDPICRVGIVGADFTPWISRITSSATVDPAVVGEPTVVSFQFRGGPPAVYLGEGPGDLRGPAPFTVKTDNGTLNGNGATVHEFVGAMGTLEVTLVPETGGTATVTVSGPCGLADLEGATAVLAVGSEFVPEPGTMLLLGTGLMGLAGYAGLRLRKR